MAGRRWLRFLPDTCCSVLRLVPFFAVGVLRPFGEGGRVVLVEFGLVEQRLAAVKEVVDDGARSRMWLAARGWPTRRCTSGSCGPSGSQDLALVQTRQAGLTRVLVADHEDLTFAGACDYTR